MMGNYGYMMGGADGAGLFGLLTWVLLVIFLVLGSLYFWKQINKKK